MKRAVATKNAPNAIGPYSQAVETDQKKMVFCSGQVGLDPRTQTLVEGGLEAETRCALENLKAVLGATGLSLSDVVKTTVYLTDMADYQAVNAIYAEYFDLGTKPARAAIAVAGLPAGARVEIDAIAVG